MNLSKSQEEVLSGIMIEFRTYLESKKTFAERLFGDTYLQFVFNLFATCLAVLCLAGTILAIGIMIKYFIRY